MKKINKDFTIKRFTKLNENEINYNLKDVRKKRNPDFYMDGLARTACSKSFFSKEVFIEVQKILAYTIPKNRSQIYDEIDNGASLEKDKTD